MSVRLEDVGLRRFSKISEIYNSRPVYSLETDTIYDVIEKIISKNHRRVPITNKKNELLGIISTSDILDAFLRGQDFKETIMSVMVRDVIYCSIEDSIDFVLQKLKLSRRGGFPIVDGKKLSGMIGERDFVSRFWNIKFNLKIENLMTRKPFYVKPTITILDCLKSMVNTHYRRLPVVEDGIIVGIITGADLLSFLHTNKFVTHSLSASLSSIVKNDVITVDGGSDVSDAIRLMKSNGIGGLLVVDGNKKLEGIITERDIIEELV